MLKNCKKLNITIIINVKRNNNCQKVIIIAVTIDNARFTVKFESSITFIMIILKSSLSKLQGINVVFKCKICFKKLRKI